jgi:hypothetical protein
MDENPYTKRIVKGDNGPVLARLPQHYFEDGAAMERELIKYELTMAMMPNTQPLGFPFHAALVYKDGEGKVYSCGFSQHHAILKDTPENQKALKPDSMEDTDNVE